MKECTELGETTDLLKHQWTSNMGDHLLSPGFKKYKERSVAET